jgi:hypothetical protein
MSDPLPECDNLFVLSIRLAPEPDKPLPQPGKQRTTCQRRDSSSRMLTSFLMLKLSVEKDLTQENRRPQRKGQATVDLART